MIDEGTTGVRVAVVGSGGAVVSSASHELTQHFPRPGWVEHDPEEIWRLVVGCAGEALAGARLAPRDVRAIGITNQRETLVVWDRATGAPVGRAIVWQDRRSARLCARLVADGYAPLVSERTGLVVDPYFTATKLAWLFEDDPSLRRRAETGELCVGTVDSWLVWRLVGRHATDVTNASRTLLMDLGSAAWDEELCAVFGVPVVSLPTIEPSAGVFGENSSPLLDGAPVPVAAVVGDQQAALFGQGCFRAGQTKNTYGTGSFVLQHAGDAPPLQRGRLLATVACTVSGGPTEYALEGSIFSTGSAVQWLRDGLGVVSDAADTEQLAASLASNDGVYFVPALAGLGAPVWDPDARGTLLGATRGTTRAHLARAVLESIAYQSRDVLEELRLVGTPVWELRVDGGAAANRWLMQFQADIAGVPVDVASERETTALGAAHAAGLASGLWRDREELDSLRRSAERFEPTMPDATRESLYSRWLEARSRSGHWASPDSADAPRRAGPAASR